MDVEKELEQIILQKSTVSECLICNIKFNHINTATAHYESKNHKKNTAQFRANALLEAKCRVPLVYQRPDQKQQTYNCDVCKISLYSKSLKESHVNGFPHADLLKLKRDLIRKGHSPDLYTLHLADNYIYCTLCKVLMICTSDVKAHCNSPAHQDTLSNLFLFEKPVLKVEHISKWYYCKICDKNLDGTSDSINHKHYATLERTPTTTTSANAQDDVVKIPLERLYTTLRIITRPDPDPPLLFPDTKSKSDSKTSSDLRGQIVNELEKLVQSLYYSNKVPEGVALEYLKKVNEEVKTIIGTHSKPESVNTTNAANGVVPKAKTVNDIGSTNQINETQPQEVKLPSPEKAVNVQVLKQEPKIVASSKQPASPFSKLLNQIVDEKLRLQKAGIQTNATKLKVIDEIEILLLQVSEPNLPIQEILDCLQKFNQIIALDCVKTQSSQPCFEM